MPRTKRVAKKALLTKTNTPSPVLGAQQVQTTITPDRYPLISFTKRKSTPPVAPKTIKPKKLEEDEEDEEEEDKDSSSSSSSSSEEVVVKKTIRKQARRGIQEEEEQPKKKKPKREAAKSAQREAVESSESEESSGEEEEEDDDSPTSDQISSEVANELVNIDDIVLACDAGFARQKFSKMMKAQKGKTTVLRSAFTKFLSRVGWQYMAPYKQPKMAAGKKE
jgi:hypothetical protein